MKFIKLRPNGAELFHADVQTDRHDETNSCFSKTLRKRLKCIFVIRRENLDWLKISFLSTGAGSFKQSVNNLR